MDTGQIVAIVVLVIILVVVIAALLAWQRKRRTDELKGQFGPEYERTVEDRGDRRVAEQELAERQEHRSKLQIRELDAVRRQQFSDSWQHIQSRFVDEPDGAVSDAHRLVREVMGERGYPTDDFEQQADDVSVDHPDVVGDYREAVRINDASQQGRATTEELREAMVHYRSLFARLLGEQGSQGTQEARGR